MTVDFILGQRVRYTARLYRGGTPYHQEPTPGEIRFGRTWQRVDIGKNGHGQGIVTGIRTLADGDTTWTGDTPATFQPARHFTAVIITTHLRRRPVLALPDDITIEPPRWYIACPTCNGTGHQEPTP